MLLWTRWNVLRNFFFECQKFLTCGQSVPDSHKTFILDVPLNADVALIDDDDPKEKNLLPTWIHT
jgi:hypothetical protein